MITKDLTIEIEHGGIEQELNLEELDQYGDYHVDQARGLIIHAPVYTHGTPEKRHTRGDVVVGTDYEFEPVHVDREAVREQILEEVGIRLTESELDRVTNEYRIAGLEAIGQFDTTLDKYQILGKANGRIVSTDVDDALLGWDDAFGDAVNRAVEQPESESRRNLVLRMFKALQDSSMGAYEYSARITLTGEGNVVNDD